MADWYLQTGPNRYGPYTWEQIRQFVADGRILPSDMLWQSETNQWHRAGEFKALFPQFSPQPQAQFRPAPSPKRSYCGCLSGIGLVAAVVFMCIAGLVLSVVLFRNQPSRKMTVGRSVRLVSERIDNNGGILTIAQPGDALDGFTIDVPTAAYDKPVNFKVSYHPIETHDLGPYFNPVTPLIHVDNGGGYANEPMIVTLPVPEHPDYFTMAFFYDRKTGQLEGMPLIDSGNGTISVATRHFSHIVASNIRIDILQGKLDIDTGFRPGVDDWQFKNRGSWAAPRGHCAGQAISAMWYFYERRLPGERPLYGRYDNNDRGYGTIDFWQDDSWGYRLATAVHRDAAMDGYTFKLLEHFLGNQDPITFMAFAYAMLITEMPQFVGIASSTSPGGHAIIAYRLEPNKLYVADPNFPEVKQVIHYVNNRFQPYNSGDNAEAIAQGNEIAYDKIGYFAVTAMVEWDQVGLRWSQLEGGRSADEYFHNYRLKYLAGDSPDTTWTLLEDGLSLVKADTAKPGSHLEGKIRTTLILHEKIVRLSVYRGVQLLGRAQDSDTTFAGLDIDLDEGVNDLGFLIEIQRTIRDNDGVFHIDWHYVDFQRFIVIYEQVDLNGEWQGTFIINEADKLTKLIEDFIVSIILSPLVRTPLESLFEITIDEAQAREAARASIETPGVGVEMPFAFTISDYDHKTGNFTIWYTITTEDGYQQVLSTTGKFDQGIINFKMTDPDGFALDYEARLVGNDTLSGTFSSSLFGLIEDVMSGAWEVERVE